ncbi:IS66 family insertion sequence element accessory protein TnpB [Mesorhizobium sp. ORM8.1]
MLVWDRTGLVLVHKRLEGSKFVWPQVRRCACRRRCSRPCSKGWIGDWFAPSGHGVRSLADECGTVTQLRCLRWRSRCSCA